MRKGPAQPPSHAESTSPQVIPTVEDAQSPFDKLRIAMEAGDGKFLAPLQDALTELISIIRPIEVHTVSYRTFRVLTGFSGSLQHKARACYDREQPSWLSGCCRRVEVVRRHRKRE